jgi:hypothetical protein
MLLVLQSESINLRPKLVGLQRLLILLLCLLQLLLYGAIRLLHLSLGGRLQGERFSLGYRRGAFESGSDE